MMASTQNVEIVCTSPPPKLQGATGPQVNAVGYDIPPRLSSSKVSHEAISPTAQTKERVGTQRTKWLTIVSLG